MINSDKAFLDAYKNGKVDKNSIVDSNIGRYLSAVILSIDDEAYKLTMGFEAKESMFNGAGVVQGGILTSMLDIAMALNVLNHVKQDSSTATISINTDFLNPAKNEALIANAEITRMGRSIAFTKAILKNNDGKLIASATANFAIT